MDDRNSLPVKTFLPISLLLAVPGWGVLIYIVTQTVPDLQNRWLFYSAIVITIAGSSFPLVAYLNRIIKPFGPADFETVIREGIMIGLYAAILLWLNKGQVLSAGLALILLVGITLIELLIRLRNRSTWHPDPQ